MRSPNQSLVRHDVGPHNRLSDIPARSLQVLQRGHPGHAYRCSKSVDANLGRLVWIFSGYHSRESPASNRVAGWEAIREGARTMWPESSGAVSLIRSLPVG